jgi:perosamine synthetase
MKKNDSETIAVNEPLLNEQELQFVTECIRTGWISSVGSFITAFEEQWASYCGRRYGVAVANGTVALQLAVAALDLKPGDEVILPTFTIISCAQAITLNGGIPVLVDSDPRTWCMDVDQVARKVTRRTRAIMPVHIYGHPVDMDPLVELADKHKIAIIEDAAEAHGAEYKSRRCGSFGLASCFSFYANKLITTGEGGMVLTDDRSLAEKLRSLRNLCFQPNRRFYHERLGFNFRLTNIQAAIGVAQIKRIDQIVQKKRHIAEEYTRRLKNFSALQLPIEEKWARNIFWMYGLVLSDDCSMNATSFAQRLQDLGIETRPFFLGMHEQPVFARYGLFAGERYPVAERLARRGLYLPSGLALSDQELAIVCAAIREVLS